MTISPTVLCVILSNINRSRVKQNRRQEEKKKKKKKAALEGHSRNSIQLDEQVPRQKKKKKKKEKSKKKKEKKKRVITVALEDADIIADSFLLVLSYAFCDPCDIPDFLSVMEIYY